MGTVIDITGQRFGNLTVIENVGVNRWGEKMWRCLCDCGNETIIRGSALRSGKQTSCGCIGRINMAQAHIKHGHCKRSEKKPRLYSIYSNLKDRCINPYNKAYKNYGGRGINVCPEWMNDFQAFYDWSMANGYKPGLTIDRIDNDKGYSPNNCRWTTYKVQANNTRRNYIVNFNGCKMTLQQFTDKVSCFSSSGIKKMLEHGMTAEEIYQRALNES